MSADYDAILRRLARTLSEMGHVLESADQPQDRIRRVLELTAELVPYRRCALLWRTPEGAHDVIVVPASATEDGGALLGVLMRVLRFVEKAEEIGRSADPQRSLTLPVIGLDEIFGLVRVEPADDFAYEARHVRLLSVVAAQLGAYLTMIRLRAQEARRLQELAAAHDFQQLLVGVVSHDLRNPLGVIIAVAQSLLRTTKDERQIKSLERALNSARRASRIINDLLDVTHVRVSGGMRINRQQVDLRTVLSEAVDDLRIAHPGRELRLETMGEAAAPGEWDPDRVTQAATNLINNALQHGEPASPVVIRLEPRTDDVVIEVHNRGPAIARDALSLLFDPFKRGSQAKRRVGGGLGLGLYIVDQIVRSHGGTLEVNSTDAEGTTFRLLLPRHGEATQSAGSGGGDDAAHGGLEGRATVMVVDDEPDVRSGVAELLERRGHKVVTAANGEDALEQLRAGLVPGLILLDLAMPVMDGQTFYGICQADPALSAIPIFILSGDVASALKLTRAGGTEFLAKPVHAQALLAAVERITEA